MEKRKKRERGGGKNDSSTDSQIHISGTWELGGPSGAGREGGDKGVDESTRDEF